MTQYYAIEKKYGILGIITADDQTEFSEIESAARSRVTELRPCIPFTIREIQGQEVLGIRKVLSGYQLLRRKGMINSLYN
ncbi:MAG: hypothetical protein AABX16_05555 [Nanoarchaeota archaeon]